KNVIDARKTGQAVYRSKCWARRIGVGKSGGDDDNDDEFISSTLVVARRAQALIGSRRPAGAASFPRRRSQISTRIVTSGGMEARSARRVSHQRQRRMTPATRVTTM